MKSDWVPEYLIKDIDNAMFATYRMRNKSVVKIKKTWNMYLKYMTKKQKLIIIQSYDPKLHYPEGLS